MEDLVVTIEKDGAYYTRTNSSGIYSRDVPEGEYTVSVSDAKVEGDSEVVMLQKGETTNLDLNATLLSTGTLNGTVTDEEGLPVERAFISIHEDGQTVEYLSTGQDGTYAVELSEGDYSLSISEDGIVREEATVSIVNGETTTEDIEFQGPTTVKGKVTDTEGETLEEIDLTVRQNGEYVTQTPTSPEGEYAVELAEGTYTVELSDSAYEDTTREITVTDTDILTEDFELTPLNTGTFEGTVTDEEGNPVEEVSISIRRGGQSVESVSTAQDGTYVVELGEGEYALWISEDGFLREDTTVTIAENATTIKNFELERPATIEGTVTNEAGTALEGVGVSAEKDGRTYYTRTGSDGKFSRDVPEGNYTISIADVKYDADSFSVTLSKEETMTQNFDATLLSTGTLKGNVTNESGEPVEAAYVQINVDGKFVGYTTTAADGTYSVDVAEDEYNLIVRSVSSRAISTGISTGVSVTTDESTTEDFVLNDTEAVEGAVLDETDTELSDVGVEFRQDGESLFTLWTEEDGSYQTVLPPGEYTISVDEGGYEAQTHEITVTEGESTTQDFGLVAEDDSDESTSDGGGGAPSLGPPDFEVTVRDAPDTVTVGETVSVQVAVKNVGGKVGEQTITLTNNGVTIAEESVELNRDQQLFVTLSGEVDESAVGEQTFTISSDDDSVETVILVEGDAEEDAEETDDSDATDADGEESDANGTDDDEDADEEAAEDEEADDEETDEEASDADTTEDADDGDQIPEDDDQPGFGITIAVLALLGLMSAARLSTRQH